jgi:type I restriction enzyme S subunit
MKYFLDIYLYARIFTEKKEGNTPYIVMATLTEMQVYLPALKEQTKIANFLTAIDEKITNNQTQLDAVKQYKQGLLQQMFV